MTITGLTREARTKNTKLRIGFLENNKKYKEIKKNVRTIVSIWPQRPLM
jgi:hypothetical protein